MDDTPAPATRAHVPAFDGLRAVAAVAVVLAHCAAGRGALALLNTRVGLGALGVDLFFALSGFLITGILLGVRDGGAPGRGLVRFYVRRALRIFPLYYLAFAIYLVLDYPGIRDNAWWFVAYAVNVGKALGVTGWAPLNHFWTLAVEEQFYLLWPALVLAVPRARLGAACLALAAASLAFRCVLELAGANDFAVLQLTPGCLEPLALGSWFAVKGAEGKECGSAASRLAWIGLVLTLVCMALPRSAQDALSRAAHALLFAPLLPVVASMRQGPVRAFLCAAPVRFVGTVSYGLYVWHVPVLDAINQWTPMRAWTAELPRPASGMLLFAVALPASIAVASISWFAFERAFVRLKTRFE